MKTSSSSVSLLFLKLSSLGTSLVRINFLFTAASFANSAEVFTSSSGNRKPLSLFLFAETAIRAALMCLRFSSSSSGGTPNMMVPSLLSPPGVLFLLPVLFSVPSGLLLVFLFAVAFGGEVVAPGR